MTSFILACVLWSKPNVKLIEVPVDEWGMATYQGEFLNHQFEATVIEERLNSVKIISKQTGAIGEANSIRSYELTTLTVRQSDASSQASLDCEIKKVLLKN